LKKYAIIVAAGSGTRMNNSVPKQFLLLNNKTVLWHSLNAFLEAYDDLEIILVLAKDFFEKGNVIVQSTISPQRIKIVEGGETRFHSVKNGLEKVINDSIVFVHDGVRCLITKALIHNCYKVALKKGNAIPSVGAVDSVRIETADGNKIVDRNTVHIIQTPQTFLSDVLKKAFEQDYNNSFTDEASVVEKSGIKINLIEGEISNIKITQPIDLVIAEKILQERKDHH
jgi:2-C-methyl-D-erythritol 4-phosphate cytidylyltransferase